MSTASAPAPAGPDPAGWPPRDGVAAAHGPALLEWATRTAPQASGLCLVRGARGTGKSRLLAWFLAGSARHPSTTVHAALLAEGSFTDAAAWDLGRQLGYGPLPPDRLLERLAADRRPLLLMVADLHRAGRGPADRPAADPAALVRDLLVPLLELPRTRAVVEVGDTDLLDGLAGVAAPDAVTTLDLGDVPRGEPTAPPPAGEDPLAGLPRTPEGRVRWDQAPEEVREHALDRALDEPDPASAVSALLADPGFLLHGPAVAVAACLADDRVPAPPGLRQAWRLAGPLLSDVAYGTAERAAVLHTAALATSRRLARFLRPLVAGHAHTAVWARQDVDVTALAAPPGRPGTLLAADPLGGLADVDADTGRYTASVPAPVPGALRPRAVAVRGEHGLLLLDGTGSLHPAGDDPNGALGRLATHHGRAGLLDPSRRATAVGLSPCGRFAVVGDEAGSVHVWNLEAAAPQPVSHGLHSAPVTAVTCLVPPGGAHPLVVSAAMDGAVRLWATSADPMPVPVEQRPALVTALACAPAPEGPVLAAAWNDGSLHLWQLAAGSLRTLPLLLPCSALALTLADPSGSALRLTLGGSQGAYAVDLDTARLWDGDGLTPPD